MGTKLRIYPGKPYGFTHIGGKDNQEDCLYPNINEITENTLSSLFLICDGVGGRDNGEVASATVCEAFSHFFQEHPLAENEVFTEERFTARAAGMGILQAIIKNGNNLSFCHVSCRRMFSSSYWR